MRCYDGSGRKKVEVRHRSRRSNPKGKHLWNGCGSEAGKDERKQTENRVCGTGRKRTGNQPWMKGRSDGDERNRSLDEKPTVRRRSRGQKGRSRRLSSRRRNRRGRKKPEGKGTGRRRKQKASTRGTAVGAKRGRTKGNKQEAEYQNWDGRHEKSGWRERGRPQERKRGRSAEEATVRRRQEAGKGRNRG